MKKKFKLILLNTNDVTTFNYGQICLDTEGYYKDKLVIIHKPNLKRVKPKHLHSLSDDEIKDKSNLTTNSYYYIRNHYNEWYIGLYNGNSFDFINNQGNFNPLGVNNCFKVIASTDKSLNLPTLPKEYLDYYISEYNKGNAINEIELEVIEASLYGKVLLPKSPHNTKENSNLSIYNIYPVIKNNEVIPVFKLDHPIWEEIADINISKMYSEDAVEELAKQETKPQVDFDLINIESINEMVSFITEYTNHGKGIVFSEEDYHKKYDNFKLFFQKMSKSSKFACEAHLLLRSK